MLQAERRQLFWGDGVAAVTWWHQGALSFPSRCFPSHPPAGRCVGRPYLRALHPRFAVPALWIKSRRLRDGSLLLIQGYSQGGLLLWFTEIPRGFSREGWFWAGGMWHGGPWNCQCGQSPVTSVGHLLGVFLHLLSPPRFSLDLFVSLESLE